MSDPARRDGVTGGESFSRPHVQTLLTAASPAYMLAGFGWIFAFWKYRPKIKTVLADANCDSGAAVRCRHRSHVA